MRRIPYEVLALQVDRLYNKDFPEDSTQSIEEHCEFIQTFIQSCGWDLDDFIRWSFHGKDPDNFWN